MEGEAGIKDNIRRYGKDEDSKLYGVKSVNRRRIGYGVITGNGRRVRQKKKNDEQGHKSHR